MSPGFHINIVDDPESDFKEILTLLLDSIFNWRVKNAK
jgi:hypothetical protein